MRMFLFNRSVPERDGALENDLVVHENTHGITNRMTGGGTGRYVKHFLRGTVATMLTILYIAFSVGACRLWRPRAWERAGRMRSQSTSSNILTAVHPG